MTTTRYIHIALELWGVVFCMISALCVFILDRKKGKSLMIMQCSNAFLLIFDVLSWIFRGNVTTLGYYMVRISNYLTFMMGYATISSVTIYIKGSIFKKVSDIDNILSKVVYIFCILEAIMLTVSQFTHIFYDFDSTNHYYRKDLFWVSQSAAIIAMIIDGIIIIRNRKQLDTFRLISSLSYLVLTIFAIVMQIFIYGISILNIFVTISVLFMFIESIIEKSRELVEQERQLNAAKLNLMMSQIKPHFVFNVLSTIRYLCKKDPNSAVKAIEKFSGYLRGSMSVINKEECISFANEMKIVKNYLYLEKIRFEDKLNIEYDINAEEFVVPALSIQPIVENAVKHGILERDEGGTLKIITKENENEYVVCIADDGVGFNPNVKKDDGRVHVGISNVADRIKIMCNGRLNIESVPEKGTKAFIYIPK